MQYLLLLYADESGGAALPKEEMARWMEKVGAYGEALAKAGALVSNGGLGLTRNAAVVHLDDGELRVHNGPYAETQEQLGGYYLIDVAGMEEAQQWAARCPAAIWGHIEIRQVVHG